MLHGQQRFYVRHVRRAVDELRDLEELRGRSKQHGAFTGLPGTVGAGHQGGRMRDLNVAIVGMGSAGRAHAKAWGEVKGARLAGIVSKSTGGTHTFDQLLADKRVDVVD